MKITILFLAMLMTSFGSETALFFDAFMAGSPINVERAEMNQDRFKVWLILQHLDDAEILLKQGVLPVDKIKLVTPLGIKAMTDRGIEMIAWDKVGGEIASKLGWSEQVQIRYAAQKQISVRENNSTVAAARLKAVKAENAGNADASRSNAVSAPAPALGFESYPSDVQATIRRNALIKWPEKYDMQVYEIEKQTSALNTFNLWRKTGIPGLPLDVSSRVMKQSWEKWGCNFDMCIYHAQNQAEAFRKLSGR